ALEVVEGAEHQTEVLAGCGARACGNVRLHDRHCPAGQHEVRPERAYFGRQELSRQARLVHDVADHGSEQPVADQCEGFFIGHGTSHFGIAGTRFVDWSGRRSQSRAATTMISTRNSGRASPAWTVARAGVLPDATHLSQTSFISLKRLIS